MNESKMTNNKGRSSSMDDSDNDAAQETWETGVRRRRGRSSSNVEDGDNDNGSSQGNHVERRPNSNRGRSIQSNNSRHMHANPAPDLSGRNFAAGMGAAGGLCGGNGAAVGVLTSPAAGTMGTFGGGAPSTPRKPPMKDSGLVAVTPSSVTTAGETAESTLLSHLPLNVRRRLSSRPNGAPSLRRQYQLLSSQIALLLGSSGLGLILFLFYALPLAAFISLLLMVSSMGALIPVARSAILARYELEMQHPLGLTRYLPDSLRVMLTETTLHEFMMDDTFFMENRYLMLYFMPGLEPEQLMGYIDRLPARHREALLEPGLGRMMPSVMQHLMRGDINNGRPANVEPLQLENNDNSDASTASGLTYDREHHIEGGEDNMEDAQVTILEAVTGLHRTLTGFALDNSGDRAHNVAVGMPVAPPVAMQPIANATPVIAENHTDIQDDDDNSSFEFSIDLSANMPRNEETDAPVPAPAAPANSSELQNVIVELPPQSPDSHSNDQLDETRQQYELEGIIISEAASAAVANYAGQASAVARETASEAVETTSSWIVRAGALSGLVAGGGGVMAAMLANRGAGSTSNLFVTMGTMTGSIQRSADSANSSSNGADGSNVSSNSEALSGRQVGGYTSSQWINGLLTTSAISFAGAGFAYFIRDRVRADIAANREAKRLKDEADQDNDDDDN